MRSPDGAAVECSGLVRRFGERVVLDGIDLTVPPGERLLLTGPNGSGKTTLLRVLTGEEDADAGDVKWGANLNIGYYDQRLDDFDPELTIGTPLPVTTLDEHATVPT